MLLTLLNTARADAEIADTTATKRFPYNASIDRIEAGGPYSFGNIQLVCRCLNSWRSDTPLDVFVTICKAIAEFQTKKEREVTDGSQSRLSIAK
jgi:hypothetical protein